MKDAARKTGIITAAFTIFFIFYEYAHHNFEFIFYSFILLALLFVVIRIHRRVVLSNWIWFSLSFFALLHLMGGNLYWGDTKFYDLSFVYNLVHYDNFVHSFGIFLITLIVYNLIFPFIDTRVRDRYSVFYLILILMALGVGAVSEIVELTAVVFFGAEESVGDYLNNALDLVFNGIGSLLAVFVIHRYLRHKMKFKL